MEVFWGSQEGGVWGRDPIPWFAFHWVRVRVRSRGWGDSAQWPGFSDAQDRCWQVRTHTMTRSPKPYGV